MTVQAGPSAALAAPATTAFSRHRSFLAFDFGTRRIGTAVGNTLLRQAQALRTLPGEGDASWKAIAAVLAEWQPDELVVGVPRHPDGVAHDTTRRAERFARQLEGRFRLPVHRVDERYSTVEAQRLRPADLDAGAAAVILAQFLDGVP